MAKTSAWDDYDSFGVAVDEDIALSSALADWHYLEAMLCGMADMQICEYQSPWDAGEDNQPTTMLKAEMDFIVDEAF